MSNLFFPHMFTVTGLKTKVLFRTRDDIFPASPPPSLFAREAHQSRPPMTFSSLVSPPTGHRHPGFLRIMCSLDTLQSSSRSGLALGSLLSFGFSRLVISVPVQQHSLYLRNYISPYVFLTHPLNKKEVQTECGEFHFSPWFVPLTVCRPLQRCIPMFPCLKTACKY